ncbi:MAG: tRNA pseudouridine(13) synthase TruD [Halofilum sp. (in: g-proteobacteria)]
MTAFARAWGGPGGQGDLRTEAADFRVDEVLGFEPGGGGEHAWLWLRKRGANTEDVAHTLARFAGVRRGAVGFSGMKDRHAETAQWFSIHLPGREDPDWSDLDPAAGAVESAVRHNRKLRIGSHRANRFVLRLRAVEGDRALIDARLAAVRDGGFPNYFGPQRFGYGGENLRRARRLLAPDAVKRARGIHLSAARSWLFNRVLDARVRDGSWIRPVPGDALMLAGTNSVFEYRGDEEDIGDRHDRFDLDVTGPLWGTGRQPVGEAVAQRERAWLADEEELRAGLERIDMQARRRALRAAAPALAWDWQGTDLALRFTLGRGIFATSLLDEAVTAVDVSRADADRRRAEGENE